MTMISQEQFIFRSVIKDKYHFATLQIFPIFCINLLNNNIKLISIIIIIQKNDKIK